ncbi:hypothetical protein N0V85_004107 [Neurospora sp. IMI 360204]|nr:hypothetical protein N0V85_004107 [Neurospora sp. IMI 360204]
MGSMAFAELSEPLFTVDDLGNPIYLQKQDVLRDMGIETPPLQIVLIGGLSSGKTSLLERLTGCTLPYGGGPTTRFATRLTFRRDPIKSIVTFITPKGWSQDEDTVKRLRSFHHVLDNLDAKTLADTVEEQPNLAFIDTPGLLGAESLGPDNSGKKKRSLVDGIARNHLTNEQTLQRTEVLRHLSACKKERLALGPPRDTSTSQREYLMERVSTFERLASAAMEGHYGADRLFNNKAVYRLVTNITGLNYNFCNAMRQRGHTYYFKNEKKDDGQFDLDAHSFLQGLRDLSEWAASYEELGEFLHPDKGEEVNAMTKQADSIISYLRAVTAGLPRVGIQSTPGESIFTMIFHKQAENWTLHANYLMKAAIFNVHRFICQLMEDVFEDSWIRTELQDLLSEKILKAYKRAWDHKEFLVKIELCCRSQTYNPHLDAAILKIGRENFRTTLIESYNDQKCGLGSEKAFNAAVKVAFRSSGVEDDLHDLLQAYYTIAIDRFLDNICRQAVSYFLLEADESPVKILTAEFIANLSDSQLDRIAGEDAVTRATRLSLDAKREPLENALKVLRD